MIFETEKEIKQVKMLLAIAKNSTWPSMKGDDALLMGVQLESFYHDFLKSEKNFNEGKKDGLQKEEQKTDEEVKTKRNRKTKSEIKQEIINELKEV